MGSDDFTWVAQAIAIHREVGGNLAEVLDAVGHTIRERNQIRRQVKALSAEGKLSAIVLMALPFGVIGFISMTNPGYLAKFTESLDRLRDARRRRRDADRRRPVAQEDRGDQVLMTDAPRPCPRPRPAAVGRRRSPVPAARAGRCLARPGGGSTVAARATTCIARHRRCPADRRRPSRRARLLGARSPAG